MSVFVIEDMRKDSIFTLKVHSTRFRSSDH
jgi:hypothetical protein